MTAKVFLFLSPNLFSYFAILYCYYIVVTERKMFLRLLTLTPTIQKMEKHLSKTLKSNINLKFS